MVELTLPADTAALARVLDFVDEQLSTCGHPEKIRMQIALATEEIYVNIARYAYRPDTGPVTIGVDIGGSPPCVTLTFTDHGAPYDPLANADPDTALPADAREIGGLGIFMAKKSMDRMHYEYRDKKNILTLVKRLAY